MIRRFISTLLAVAVATGVYMPYSHEEAAPAMSGAVAHEACAGHDAGSWEPSHLSDCLSQILVKHSIERPTVLPDLPARDTAYHGLVSVSYGLPPVAVRWLSLGLSPPGRAPPLQTPAPFIGVTVLLI